MIKYWMSVTMLIEVEEVGFGTGFLIQHAISTQTE